MLAFNHRKQNRSDPVREILARIEEKQSKTGLSLYASNNEADDIDGYSLPNVETNSGVEECPGTGTTKSSFFPDVKAAREKAQTRITTNLAGQQTMGTTRSFAPKRTKRAPHRLPGSRKDRSNVDRAFPPSNVRGGTAALGDEKISNAYNANDFHMNKDSIDININPFGYNRKTLAFDNRKINYVVEWPETWPFKIMSFQRSSKAVKTQLKSKIPQPCHHKDFATPAPVSSPAPVELPWKHYPNQARVLAPVDPPSKPHPLPNKPFLNESVRRQFRKPQSRDSKEGFYQSYCKEAGITFKREALPGQVQKRRRSITEEEAKSTLPAQDSLQDGERECSTAVSSVDATASTQLQENSVENKDSQEVDKDGIRKQDSCHSNKERVPPSTPIPPVLQSKEDVTPENTAKEVLNDIVNQIIAEDNGIAI